MDPSIIEERLRQGFPDARIGLKDLTGTGDHWSCTLVSGAFEGLNPVRRHQAVYACLTDLMAGDSAPIHALQLNTLTPSEAGEENP